MSDIGNTSSSNYQLALDKLDNGKKEVLKFLAQNGNTSKADLESIPGTKYTQGYIRNVISNLNKSGYIERTDNGQRGTPAFYNLTKEGMKLALFAKFYNDPWLEVELSFQGIY